MTSRITFGGGGGGGSSGEQGIGFEDLKFLYILYGEDDKWEVERFSRDLTTRATTGKQTGNKPASLSTIAGLTYT